VSELAAVEGVAAVKAERYGAEFLEITMKFTCKLSGNKHLLTGEKLPLDLGWYQITATANVLC